mgnify:CR=1 FL=1
MSAKKMTKKQICDAAVGMYLDNPSRFSLSTVANQLEIPRSQIYQNFPTKNAVLRFFYQDCFEQYLKQTEELEDYQDFTLEEKLSHMVYTHFELFHEWCYHIFVEAIRSCMNEVIHMYTNHADHFLIFILIKLQ